MPDKRKHPILKTQLHPRNRHRERYDFKRLIVSCPELALYVKLNEYGDESVDFFNPDAVKMLNKALLKHFYGIGNWDIPNNYLCPPIPGRADYIHHIADLLGSRNVGGKIPEGSLVKCLDIGVGANCVYPIIGNREYGWLFVGTDIDPVSVQSATRIVASNPVLQGKIEIRRQLNANDIFIGSIQKDEFFDLSICNPPFHASAAEAQQGSLRKLRNLKQKTKAKPILNFGGQSNELWCDGGEGAFVEKMIVQSKLYHLSCFWFSTLISKETSLKDAYSALKRAGAVEVKTMPMSQGNKTSRIVAWTFLTTEQQKKWALEKWNPGT